MNKERFEKVLENMKKHNIDQMVITSPESIFYLLGEWIHPGERMLALYVNKKSDAKLFINELFPLKRDLGVDVCVYNDREDPIIYLSEVVSKDMVMGIDKDWPSHFLIRLLKQKDLKVEIGSIAVDEARVIKDMNERSLMRESSKVNDKVMGDIVDILKEGMTEIEACSVLKDMYKKHGAKDLSFEPLICFGEGAAEPHHSSDDTVLKKGDCIIIDIGGIKDNYCSDMTRSFIYGDSSEEYNKIYELVLKANLAGIEAVKPGVYFSDIDKAARNVIENGGYGKYFTHRTGHNIGISVHEYPDVGSANNMVVEEGMIFSIEPGIYMQGRFGVRIEDLVLVTNDGCEVLNKYPKELTALK